MTDPTTTDQQAAVDAFNDAHPIGTTVRYWTGDREGDGKTSTTRTVAEVLGGHTAVVWVEGEASCIALTHVEPMPGQPDGIEDDSRDIPDPHRAAERVSDYIRATGDGLYDVQGGAPLYGRDLEALTRATEQLADAHAAAARSATEADQLRLQVDALEDARRQLSTEATKWKTRLIDETDRLREQLDRANTERQTLAQELAEARNRECSALCGDIETDRDRLRKDWRTIRGELDTMTAVARTNKQHVATLTAIVERVSTLVDRLHHEGLATVHTEELRQALNAPVPAAGFPGSSRRAQDAVGLDWHGLRSTVEHAIHTRLTAAWPGLAEADMVFMEQVAAEAARGALGVPQLQIAASAPWELTSAEWAVIRAAIAWRLWYGGHYDPTVASACNDLAEAVDALPHTGEPQPEQPTKAPWPSAKEAALLWHNTYEKHLHPDARVPWSEVPEPVRAVMIATAEKMLDFLRRRMGGIPAPKLAQGGTVSGGTPVTLHFNNPPTRYIPVPFDPRTGRVL